MGTLVGVLYRAGARARTGVRGGKTFPTFPTFPNRLILLHLFRGTLGGTSELGVTTFPPCCVIVGRLGRLIRTSIFNVEFPALRLVAHAGRLNTQFLVTNGKHP